MVLLVDVISGNPMRAVGVHRWWRQRCIVQPSIDCLLLLLLAAAAAAAAAVSAAVRLYRLYWYGCMSVKPQFSSGQIPRGTGTMLEMNIADEYWMNMGLD